MKKFWIIGLVIATLICRGVFESHGDENYMTKVRDWIISQSEFFDCTIENSPIGVSTPAEGHFTNIPDDISSSGTDIDDTVSKRHTAGSETQGGDISGTVGNAMVNKLKDKVIDETDIGDDKILVYKIAGTKYVFEEKLSGGVNNLTILPFSYDSIEQGTWGISLFASHYLGVFYNISTNDGDGLNYKVNLDTGTYTLLFLHAKDHNCGITKFILDGVEVASFDLYRNGMLANQSGRQTGIVIASSGLKTLQLKIDGKNASSSDYATFINYVALWRTE